MDIFDTNTNDDNEIMNDRTEKNPSSPRGAMAGKGGFVKTKTT